MPVQPGATETPAAAKPAGLLSETSFDASSKIVNAEHYTLPHQRPWERWYGQIKTARMIRRVEQGKPALSQREMQRLFRSLQESGQRWLTAFNQSPTSIGKLSHEQLMQQIHARYPDGLQALLNRQPDGSSIPMNGNRPLSGDQEAYLAVLASQKRAKPEEIANLRGQLQSMNYIYFLYERYGGTFVQPNQPPYLRNPSQPISRDYYRMRQQAPTDEALQRVYATRPLGVDFWQGINAKQAPPKEPRKIPYPDRIYVNSFRFLNTLAHAFAKSVIHPFGKPNPTEEAAYIQRLRENGVSEKRIRFYQAIRYYPKDLLQPPDLRDAKAAVDRAWKPLRYPPEQPADLHYPDTQTYGADALRKSLMQPPPEGFHSFFTQEEMERILYTGDIQIKRGDEIRQLLKDNPHPAKIGELYQSIQAAVPGEKVYLLRDRRYGDEKITMPDPAMDKLIDYILNTQVQPSDTTKEQSSLLSEAELGYVRQAIASGTPLKEVREIVRITLYELFHARLQVNP